MSFLSKLWGRTNPSLSPIGLSYLGLQHYFQLFQKETFAITPSPTLTHEGIQLTGSLLKACGLPEQTHFLGASTASFEEIGSHVNSVGGISSYGLYSITPPKNAPKQDYLFISIMSKREDDRFEKPLIEPHFLLIGRLMAHAEGPAVHPVVMASQIGLDDAGNVDFITANCRDPHHVTTHLAFADFPHRFVLGNIPFPAPFVAKSVIGMPPEVLFQKFDFLSRSRTPALWAAELEELKEQFATPHPQSPSTGRAP